MAANQFLSLTGAATGLAPASAASAWGYGSYVEIVSAASNTTGKSIIGLSFQVTNVPALDTTHELIFDIGTGAGGAEVTKLQVPYSFRNDTQIGYYLTNTLNVFFPEPYFLAGGTRLAVKVADTLASAITYNGVKVLYEELAPALTQAAFRLYEDGTEAGSTAIAAQDTNITRDVTADSNLQLRVRLQETFGVSGISTDDYQLQYSKNSGTYTDVVDPPILYRSQETGSGSSTFTLNGGTAASSEVNQARGFSFITPSIPRTVDRIDVSLIKLSSPTDGVYIELLSGNISTGTLLATSATIDNTAISTSFSYISFTFTGVALSASTEYFVRIIRTGARDITNRYAQERTLSDTDTGSTWVRDNNVWGSLSANEGKYRVYSSDTPQVKGYNSASLTDGNATTNRLGAGTGSFVAGEISEDGLVDDSQITASNYAEELYSLTLVAAALANNDTLDFRVLRNGATTRMTYTVTPRITVSKTGGGTASSRLTLLGVG